MAATKIEWAQAVWNPVTGCSKVSTGCAHCYAETMAKRLCAMKQQNYRRGFLVTRTCSTVRCIGGGREPSS